MEFAENPFKSRHCIKQPTMLRKGICMGIIVALFSVLSVQAQEEPSGKFAVDLTFEPAAIFDAAAGSMFNMPMIKGRYFISNSMAVRVGVDYNWRSAKDYYDVDGNNYSISVTREATISAGIEKQFGTAKFKPYLGGDVLLSNLGSIVETTNGGTTIIEKNTNGGHFATGVYVVLGADYYLLPNLYVGAEFSPGVSMAFMKDEKVDGTVTDKGGRATSASLSSTSGLRLGFRF